MRNRERQRELRRMNSAGIYRRNTEQYPDPTAYAALCSVRRDERQAERAQKQPQKKAGRPLVYICSPLAGDVEGNQERARKYCRFAVERGVVPLAPHIYFPQFMDDCNPNERKLALYLGRVLQSKCVEIWIFGETISAGMQTEIDWAEKRGQRMRHFTVGCEEVKND